MRELLLIEEKELAQIHRTSLRILCETGLVIDYERALRILQEHGARVDWNQKRARFTEDMIGQAVSTIPDTFTLAGSDQTRDVTLALHGRMHGRCVVGADFVVDPRDLPGVDPGAPRHRPATLRDVEEWVRLADRLPNIHIVSGPYPNDVPETIRDLSLVERALEFSRKPVFVSHYSDAALRWSLKLMSALPDRGRSRLIVYVSCNSPLYFTQPQVEILLTAAEHKVPVAINSAALAGANAPYTLAGLAAQLNAELLAGVTLAQLAHPGAPMLWSPLLLVFDMRTTGAASGYAENALLFAALAQLGKSYRMPTHCLGLVTDAVIPDAQAGLEKGWVPALAMLARPSLLGGAGGLASYMVASVEQLILDNDILGGLFRVQDGLQVDDDTLAYEVVNRVGPRGQFLDDPHTLRYLRREYYLSQTANRLGPEAWAAAGSLDARARAAERIRSLMASPAEPAAPDDTVREMRRILQAAQADLAKPAAQAKG